MVTKLRFIPPLSGSVLTLALLTACAGSPPQQQEVAVEPAAPTVAPAARTTAPPPPAKPAALPLRPDYPESYTVVRGDTLWDISARFLKDPWFWPELWYGNPEIANPHLIYPGDVLRLHFIDGRPVMRVERPYGPEGIEYRTERLSPRIREESLDAAITTIPIDAIRPFLTRPRVVTDEELNAAPYIVANEEGRLLSGAGYQAFARGIDADNPASHYAVVRRGDVYTDPVSGEHLGIEAIYLGDAHLTRSGDPATLQISSSTREILRGDRLLPSEETAYQHRYLPRAPSNGANGQIISVLDGVSQIGQYQVVVLNLGSRDGIQPGHVLAAHQRGAVVDDIVTGGTVQLPDERAGIVMVFRSFERVSYALVMQVTKPLALHDRVANP